MIKINIKYLLLLSLIFLIRKDIVFPKKLLSVFNSSSFNLLFVIFLIKFNRNNLINLFIYFTFIIIITNQSFYENFSEVDDLKKEVGQLAIKFMRMNTTEILPLKNQIKKTNQDIANINFEIFTDDLKIQNLNSLNSLNTSINNISNGRNKAIKGDFNITTNNLKDQISEIDKQINGFNQQVADNNKEKINNDKLIAKTLGEVGRAVAPLISENQTLSSLNSREDDLREKIESDSENKSSYEQELERLRKRIEAQEDAVMKAQTKVDELKAKVEELKDGKISIDNDSKKANAKAEYLKKLRVIVVKKIDSFDNICDNPLKSIVNKIDSNIRNVNRDINSNNSNIKSLKSQIKTKQDTIKTLEKKIGKLETKLSNVEDSRDKLKSKIDDLKLKIGELDN